MFGGSNETIRGKKTKQKRIEVAVCVDQSAGGIDAGGGLIRSDG